MEMRLCYSRLAKISFPRVRYNIRMNSGSSVFDFIISTFNSIVAAIPALIESVSKIYAFFVTLAFPIALFFFIGIIYCVEQLKKIRIKEGDIYDLKVEPAFEDIPAGDKAMAHRWKNATKHVNSDNPNDWKQAILEADIILDDLLTRLGYKGESIGEKLKRVNPGDMKSLNDAWEAHKVRNQVAHQGSEYALDHHVAKQVINRYRKVFEEFYYI